MTKQSKVLHGSCSEAYINGQRDELTTKIEVKVSGDFEDASFCGDYGTFPLTMVIALKGPSVTTNLIRRLNWRFWKDIVQVLCRISC